MYAKIASEIEKGSGFTFGRYEIATVMKVHILVSCVATPLILASECGRFGGTADKK